MHSGLCDALGFAVKGYGVCFLQELVDRCAALNAKPHMIQNLVESMSKLADTYHDVEGMLQDIKELIEVSSVCISYKMLCLYLYISFCVQCLLRSMCNTYSVMYKVIHMRYFSV